MIPARPRRNDWVFNLSLTELAFVLIFVLLLLVGVIVARGQEREERLAQEAADAQRMEALRDELGRVQAELERELAGAGVANAADFVSRLVEASRDRAETRRLRIELDRAQRELTALVEVQRILRESARPGLADYAEGAIVMRQEIERALGPVGDPTQAGRELAALKQGVERETADLRGQVAYLRKRLDARGGRDFPPCWADANGTVQYLFDIEIQPGGLRIAPGWPPEREADARRLPGIAALTPATLPLPAFRDAVAGIHAASVDARCRHYVRLTNRVSDLDTFNRYRFAVEDYFYKLELARR
jgi:hypothetical protein